MRARRISVGVDAETLRVISRYAELDHRRKANVAEVLLWAAAVALDNSGAARFWTFVRRLEALDAPPGHAGTGRVNLAGLRLVAPAVVSDEVQP
jgi:hypothetical protein